MNLEVDGGEHIPRVKVCCLFGRCDVFSLLFKVIVFILKDCQRVIHGCSLFWLLAYLLVIVMVVKINNDDGRLDFLIQLSNKVKDGDGRKGEQALQRFFQERYRGFFIVGPVWTHSLVIGSVYFYREYDIVDCCNKLSNRNSFDHLFQI